MQKINSDTSIKDAILELEMRQANEGLMLKEQFNLVFENLKPINIIKNTFREAAASDDLKNDIMNTSVGLVVGYLSQKLLKDVSISPLKKLTLTAILFGITNIVAKHPEEVKAFGSHLVRLIRNKSRGRLHSSNK